MHGYLEGDSKDNKALSSLLSAILKLLERLEVSVLIERSPSPEGSLLMLQFLNIIMSRKRIRADKNEVCYMCTLHTYMYLFSYLLHVHMYMYLCSIFSFSFSPYFYMYNVLLHMYMYMFPSPLLSSHSLLVLLLRSIT